MLWRAFAASAQANSKNTFLGVSLLGNGRSDYMTWKRHVSRLDPQYHCDFAIIGGGAIGSSIAYHIKQHKKSEDADVIVFDRDLNYSRASTVLSVGSIRQQFSIPENIQLSRDSFSFLENAKSNLSVFNEDPVDISFKKAGYLFLATKGKMDLLHSNHATQIQNGAKLKLLSSDSLKTVYPWMNTDDIVGGSLGLENEGWFDPWSFLSALKRKNISMGVRYVQASIVSFPGIFDRGVKLNVTSAAIGDPAYPSASPLSMVYAGEYVNAAGAWSGQLGRLLGIGGRSEDGSHYDFLDETWRSDERLQFPIPVVPKKRYVFVFHCPNGPAEKCPMVVDPSGVYFRSEGPAGYYICGKCPSPDKEPDTKNLEVDYNFFDEEIWPVLANRVPAFESLKVTHAWAGFYDYNIVDQNGIIGYHPAFDNFLIAAGFTGHGIQMSPAVGRAAAELLLNNKFETLDMRRFSFERFDKNELIFEKNVV
ncbi:FAD-dependent oxidoreductase domain-containing protein 1-like [Symsagittifera roscoffensis]|uniref:FAD-dependent oxidoreductase domain-containing protein 1-like n=1 Tax=Symsagittifera roscoffensis TaxID=84072 RepID=UPI00307C08E5